MVSNVNTKLRFVAKSPHQAKTFDAVKVVNLATKRKSYTPTINTIPLNVSWTTRRAAVAYAHNVFVRYQRLLKLKEKCLKEKQNEPDS